MHKSSGVHNESPVFQQGYRIIPPYLEVAVFAFFPARAILIIFQNSPDAVKVKVAGDDNAIIALEPLPHRIIYFRKGNGIFHPVGQIVRENILPFLLPVIRVFQVNVTLTWHIEDFEPQHLLGNAVRELRPQNRGDVLHYHKGSVFQDKVLWI